MIAANSEAVVVVLATSLAIKAALMLVMIVCKLSVLPMMFSTVELMLAIAVGIYFNVVGAEVEVSPIEDFKLSMLFAESDITPFILISAAVK